MSKINEVATDNNIYQDIQVISANEDKELKEKEKKNDLISTLAKHLMSKDCTLKKVELPIHYIDNIRTDVFIDYNKTNIILNAKALYVFDCADEEFWTYYRSKAHTYKTVDELSSALEKVINEIESMKFDYETCKFITSNENTIRHTLRSIFESNNKTKSGSGECCICLQDTMIRTDCGHNICIPCADSTIENSTHQDCPMCRGYDELSTLGTVYDRRYAKFT